MTGRACKKFSSLLAIQIKLAAHETHDTWPSLWMHRLTQKCLYKKAYEIPAIWWNWCQSFGMQRWQYFVYMLLYLLKDYLHQVKTLLTWGFVLRTSHACMQVYWLDCRVSKTNIVTYDSTIFTWAEISYY